MAQLTSQPSGQILPRSGCIQFTGASDPSTENAEKKFAYNYEINGILAFTDATGAPKPKTKCGGNILIDLTSTLKDYLTTKCPDLSQTSPIEDTDAKIDLKLCYGDACYYKCDENGEKQENTIETPSKSNTYQVVASNFNLGDNFNIPNSGFVMSANAEHITLCKDTKDFLWVCGSVTLQVIFEFTTGQTANQSINSVGAVSCLPIGPANITIPSVMAPVGQPQPQVCKYTITGAGWTQTIHVKECCCKEDDRIDVYYQEPLGSWRAMNFECPEEPSKISRQITEYCSRSNIADFCFDTRSVMNKRVWKTITLKSLNLVTEDNECRYEAFGAAGKYKAKMKGYDGLIELIPTFSDVNVRARNALTGNTLTFAYATNINTF